MKINVRLLCVQVPFGKGNGPLIISEDATIKNALDGLSKNHNIYFPSEQVDKLVFLVNNKVENMNYKLKDKDELLILHTLGGG